MTDTGRGPEPTGGNPGNRRIGPGLWAGGIVGLLTGLCYVVLFGGLDFSRGNPLSALAALSARTLLLLSVLVLTGAAAGAIVSLKTGDD